MLGFIVLASMIVFAVITPLIVIFKYYSPKKFSIIENIFWIILSVITWPLIPIIIAVRKHNKFLLSCFWISFLIMAVSGWYWSVLNVNTIIQFQQLIKGP